MAVNQPSRNATHEAGSDPSMVHAFNQGIDPDAQQQQTQGAASQTAGQSGQFAFGSSSHFFSTVLSSHPESEVLAKIHDMFKAQFVAASPEHELEIVPVNRDDATRLAFSVIVIAVRNRAWLDRGAAFYTLILEGSAPPLEITSRFVANETIDERHVAGDMNDPTLDAEVRNRLERVYPQIPLWSAGVCVVPRDFNPENKDLARKLAKSASDACVFELARHAPGGWKDLNLAEAVGNAALTVRPTFGNEQIYNAVGHPVRSDIEIRTTIPGQPIQGQQEGTTRNTPVSALRAFTDLVWSPSEQQGMPYAQWISPQQMQAGGLNPERYRKYFPRIVITSCGTEKVPTLGGWLFAAVNAACLANGLWSEHFRASLNRSASGEVDWGNIGGINVEVNYEDSPSGFGKPVDSTLDSFTRQNGQNGSEFHRFIANSIRPQMIISADLHECGPDTYQCEALLLAGDSNSRNRRIANIMIIEALMELTSGLFLKHFEALRRMKNLPHIAPEDARLVTDEFNRIHLGHFIDRNGEKKDLRYVDYLAMLNLAGVNNHEEVLTWSDTFSNVNLPLNLRLSKRWKIIEAVCGPSVVCTGFARRTTFESDVIAAALMSFSELGVKMSLETSVLGQRQYQRSVNPFIADAALDPNVNLGFFASGYTAPSQQFGNRAGFNRFMC
ncbi:hypothetical protein [Paraburkholderia adhaesiva]|uniref:hypothetical protein n=1 Tax=Paraburkholderia adhaesiva TaxID=2883244 RepID=UPI001F191370|nr:hypothetical protein [Paraburkholderia adhaesiva]